VTTLRLSAQALERGYPISPEIRNVVVEEALRLATSAKSERVRVMALRALLAADALSLKLEASHAQERAQERAHKLREAARTLRDAQRNPAVRKAIQAAILGEDSPPESTDAQPQAPQQDA
jgi:hypothetical protein